MADINSIRVGQLPNEVISLTDKIPHEVGNDLKRATIEDLAIFISNYASTVIGVGFRAVTVLDGQTLPETDKQEFILVGTGTFYNVNGGSTIILTEELNALISNGEFWTVGVEIPVNIQSAITQSVRNGFTNTSPSEDAIYNYLLSYAKLSDLPSPIKEVVEADDFASLPLIGEIGKIYVVKDLNKIYRWNVTFYQELAYTDISLKADLVGGKVPLSQINDALLGSVNYKGTYDASTNSPTLPTVSSANKGWYYVVSTTGTQQSINFVAGDWIISNGTSWGKVDNNNNVTSVSGKVGAVTLVKADVGLSNVDNTSDTNKPVSTATQTALNSKIGGSGTTNYIPKFTGSGSVGNSSVFDNGTSVGVNGFFNNVNFANRQFGIYETSVNGRTAIEIGSNMTTAINTAAGALMFTSQATTEPTKALAGIAAVTEANINSGGLIFFTSLNGIYSSKMAIKGSGNVLIGPTTDDGVNKLQVTGSATFASSVTATSFNGSATLTGVPTAPTAPAGTNTTQIATTAFVQSNSRPYKVYTALLSQTGTNAPVATVLENTLGATITWARNSAGVYIGTSSKILSNRVMFVTPVSGSNLKISAGGGGSTELMILVYDSTGSLIDYNTVNMSFEVKVYP